MSGIPDKVGATVVTYHKWKGFEGAGVGNCFARIASDKLLELKPGAKLWLDTDPMYHRGKVYGFTLVEVKSVAPNQHGFWVKHSHGGFLIEDPKKPQHKAYRIRSPKTLARLIDQHPVITAPV